ncbi:MAG: TonB-dependent receptor [Verrucomicrobiota bacterium]|nr:TonB-dependent receptor [Verrucomicrobiota bacterium]
MSLEELMSVPVMSTTVSSVTRMESTLGDSPAAVFVITPEMIRRSGATSIPELLRMVPGVNVARLTSNQWVLSIRGFDNVLANKLLVQVDGRTVYSPIQAGVFWDTIDYPLEDIQRIEVVRGPGGALWGANAVNGVINIISKPAKETHGGLAVVGGGTEERGFATFRFGGQLGDDLHYRVYGKWFERDESFRFGGLAHDDWRSGRSGFRLDWTPASKDTVTLQGDWFSVVSGRGPLTDTESRGVDVLARWTHKVGKDSQWQLQTYYDRFQQTARNGGIQFATDTFDVDFEHQFAIGHAQKFIYGLGYRLQKILVHGLETAGVSPAVLARIDDEPTHLSAFLQDEIKLIDDRLFLTLGSKFEHNEFTGFEYQPSGRLLWTPSKNQSIWLAISRAVRTPDILEDSFDIRSPATTLLPNRTLRSEEVIAYELGYRAQATEGLSFDTALFYNQYDRLSVVTQLPPSAGSGIAPLQFTNGMHGETYGVEITATWKPADWWTLSGAYSYLKLNLHPDPKVPSALRRSAELPENQSPQNHFYIRSAFDLPGNLELDLIGRYVDTLPGFTPGIKSYLTLDARLAWKPNKNLEFAIVGQNLLDEHHPETGGSVTSPPFEVERGVYGSVTWRW